MVKVATKVYYNGHSSFTTLTNSLFTEKAAILHKIRIKSYQIHVK